MASLRVSHTPALTAQSLKLGMHAHSPMRFDARQELDLSENQIGDQGLLALSEAIGKGSLAQCTSLSLAYNQIGDPGMTALSEALGKGALPALQDIDLSGNPASDEAKEAIYDIIDSRQ